MELFNWKAGKAIALKLADYETNKEKYQDTKVLTVYILNVLRRYSSEESPLSYDDIIDYLESGVEGDKYLFSHHKKDSNRKKIQRAIHSLTLSGCDIRKVKCKYWLAEESNSISIKSDDQNAMTCFDSLMRNRYINNPYARTIATIDCMNKFNNEKFRANSFQSIILNSQEPFYKENLFFVLKHVGARNLKFSYPNSEFTTRNYIVSPLEVVYYDEMYYLIAVITGSSKKSGNLCHFRIDLMEDIVISKKTKLIRLRELAKNASFSEEELSAEKVFQLVSIIEKDPVEDYLLYDYILKNLIGNVINVDFVSTNPFVITESKVISVFGDGIKLNRKTHLFSLINVPENKFAEWAVANFDNIKIETADAKKLVDKRIKNFIEIRKVEMETQCGESYEVALNVKETDFNYRLYGILESRRAKQIVIKCTKPNLVKLRDFINQTKGSVVVSDESNINRNDIARMFHYNDI